MKIPAKVASDHRKIVAALGPSYYFLDLVVEEPRVLKRCSHFLYRWHTRLEQIEDRARRGLPIDPELILILTAYLRDVLQAKITAEALASEALKKAGLNSRSYTAGTRRTP